MGAACSPGAACSDKEAVKFWPLWSKARQCPVHHYLAVPFPAEWWGWAPAPTVLIQPGCCATPQLSPGLPQVGPAAAQLGLELIAG